VKKDQVFMGILMGGEEGDGVFMWSSSGEGYVGDFLAGSVIIVLKGNKCRGET